LFPKVVLLLLPLYPPFAARAWRRAYAQRGIAAYVEMVQREERKHQVELLTHQKWSGATLVDNQIQTATGALQSTAAMGAANTERQFTASSAPSDDATASPAEAAAAEFMGGGAAAEQQQGEEEQGARLAAARKAVLFESKL